MNSLILTVGALLLVFEQIAADVSAIIPSKAPSQIPTSSPTRLPTNNVDSIYDYYTPIIFQLTNLTNTNVQWIVENITHFTHTMEKILERNYFDTETLQYSQFSVSIKDIEFDSQYFEAQHDIVYFQRPLSMNSSIESNFMDSSSIIETSETNAFRNNTQTTIRHYLNNTHLIFNISNLIHLQTFPKLVETMEISTTSEWIEWFALRIIVAVLAVFALLCIIDYLHSQYSYRYECRVCTGHGCYKSDTFNYRLLLRVGLRITDLMADIAFTFIMTEQWINDLNDCWLWTLSLLSVLSVSIPYVINIMVMLYIPKMDNIVIERPKLWFAKFKCIFVLFTIMTGDCYLSTLIISSNIFGINIFNSGLNQVQFDSIKYMQTMNVFMECVPQMIAQSIYTYMNGGNKLILLSLALSLFTIIITVVSRHRSKNTHKHCDLIQYGIRISLACADNQEEELLKILQYRGCKERLRKTLCQLLGFEISKLDIFCIDMNNDGCIVHIMHTVVRGNETQLSIFQLYENNAIRLNELIVNTYDLKCEIATHFIVYSKTINGETIAETHLHLPKLLSSSLRLPHQSSAALEPDIVIPIA